MRLIDLLERHGVLDDNQTDPLSHQEPVLAALVPPPRIHLIRYHGVLAPNAAGRALIVPAPVSAATDGPTQEATQTTPAGRRQLLSWAAHPFPLGLLA